MKVRFLCGGGDGDDVPYHQEMKYISFPSAQDLGEAKTSFNRNDMVEPTNAQILEDVERKEAARNRAVHDLRPVGEFERSTSAGAFKLKEWKAMDIIPPSRIIDLRVVEADLPQRTVHLEWTSPGDDMDDGRGE